MIPLIHHHSAVRFFIIVGNLLTVTNGFQTVVLQQQRQQQQQHATSSITSSRRCTPVFLPCPVVSARRLVVAAASASGGNGGESDEQEWYSDFDGYDIGGISSSSSSNSRSTSSGSPNTPNDFERLADAKRDTDRDSISEEVLTTASLSSASSSSSRDDLTGCKIRQFSLGKDLVLSDFLGNMGFEEVTDWEYFLTNQDDPDDRQVVQPNPFDSKNQPKRTRVKSGSLVRLFRGELVGMLGGTVSAQGRDKRVLVKEFSGPLALELAQAELQTLGELQTELLRNFRKNQKQSSSLFAPESNDWVQAASSRSAQPRKDHANVFQLLGMLRDAPFLGILGEVYLAELEDDASFPNEFYRSLGVPPPKPDAVWIVYEYAGLSSLQAYAARPPQIRRANLPRKKGFFGNLVEPPALPTWNERANYVKAIMKQCILAVAHLHESTGRVHRSIGRSSFLLGSTTSDKSEAASIYATRASQLAVKLTDYGFSTPYVDVAKTDPEFRARARTFGLNLDARVATNSIAAANFAIAEDMHALGFVFLGVLLTVLVELDERKLSNASAAPGMAPSAGAMMPATDEDTLQRLLSDIFDKDMEQFREYVEAEEVWAPLVNWLDENDGAGWKVLETLLLAREKAAKQKDTDQLFTIRGLLANPFFNNS